MAGQRSVDHGGFAALARFAYRRRLLVVVVWLVLFAAGAALTPRLSHVLRGGGFSNPNSPSQKAAALIKTRLGQGSTSLVVVFKGTSLAATSAAFQTHEQRILAAVQASHVPGLTAIQSYATSGAAQLVSKDGKSAAAVLSFDTSALSIQQQVSGIRATLTRAARGSGLKPYLTGEPAVNADLSKASVKDLRRVEVVALPVALLALIVVFGTVVAAALPVVTGAMAVSVTLGGIYLLGHLTTMSIFCMNVATLLGLAVAIDYALFIVARFREHLHAGATVEEAVLQSATYAGRSVFFSGLGVVVGLVGLTFLPSALLRSIGVGGALVVFLSVAASLTFMPALLGLLGRRVDALRVVPLRPPHESRFWRSWTRTSLRRPWLVVVASVLVAAALAAPVSGLKQQMSSPTSLPASSESRQGADILASEFNQQALSPLSVLVTWGGGSQIDLSRAARLYAIGQTFMKTQGVASVLSPFTLPGMSNPITVVGLWPTFSKLLNEPTEVPDRAIRLTSGMGISALQVSQIKRLIESSVGRAAVLYRVTAVALPTSARARELVGALTKVSVPAGMMISVAGQAANDRDVLGDLNSRLPWISLWIVVSTYVVLFFLLRSALLPLVAIVVNWLTILVSWGVLAFVFQRGTFTGLLGFTNSGAVDAIIPIIVLCVLFGVTMDYAVFLLTRMREAWIGGADARGSVATGLIQSGRVVVSAALLVVIVVGAFAFTTVSATKMLGVGISVAVIFDTLAIRMSLLPGIMSYLGRATWWAPQLGRASR